MLFRIRDGPLHLMRPEIRRAAILIPHSGSQMPALTFANEPAGPAAANKSC